MRVQLCFDHSVFVECADPQEQWLELGYFCWSLLDLAERAWAAEAVRLEVVV